MRVHAVKVVANLAAEGTVTKQQPFGLFDYLCSISTFNFLKFNAWYL